MAIFQNASVHAARLQRRGDEVVVADRGAADGDDDVGVPRAGEVLVQALARVAGDAQLLRLGAGLLGERPHAQVVGGDDLPRPRPLAGPHQLVAGGEDGNAGTAADRHRAVPHGGRQRQLARTEATARRQQRLARREVEAPGAHVALVRRALAHRDLVALADRVLLDDDRIRAGRDRRAGEDACRLSRADGAGERMSRGRLADHGQGCRQRAHVGGTHGVAVHGGGIERRLRHERGQRLGQRAPARRLDGDRLGRQRLDAVENTAQGFFDGEGCGHEDRAVFHACRGRARNGFHDSPSLVL